ncbi:hypothetical protein [uncultured Rikenella sp.]|uniref:hypothetical protein n=2 Tax=uncultured Rikenella sp. TaxID=368003 RepID=UPI00260C2DC5|nr:hypothetical protein [uncultured Rikenella sp.]
MRNTARIAMISVIRPIRKKGNPTRNPGNAPPACNIYSCPIHQRKLRAIATPDTGRSLFFDHHDAETTRMFMGWR